MTEGNLFANDASMRLRDSKGRYATAERAYADRIDAENKLLRLEVNKYKNLYEKYFRAWQAVVNYSGKLERKMKELANIVKK